MCSAVHAWEELGSRGMSGSNPQLSIMSSVLSAYDELTACTDADTMLRLAVELARDRLGLERVGLFLRDPRADRVILRGTWGTGASGETTDEHSLFHEIGPPRCDALIQGRRQGGLGIYRASAPLFASDQGHTFQIGEGWIMATPLLRAGDVVGVMYNDAALTHTPMDEDKQAAAALLCALLTVFLLSRRAQITWQPLTPKSHPSPLVRRILQILNEELATTGDQLARELGVSPGHLARAFKLDMAMSLVEYRNRVRMDRFFEVIGRRGGEDSLLHCALEAGFGSYAQFHRIYRKLHGESPRHLFEPERSQTSMLDKSELPARASTENGLASSGLRP
jgi:AraC-like DNA-binding protein